MLAHDFQDMPSKNVGETPLLTTMTLRCKWCMKTPSKARDTGCPVHELEENGLISLSDYNPDGVEYFKGRTCVTCERPIMDHQLRRGSTEYWCYANQNQFSYGVNNCTTDVANIDVPVEPTGIKQ